MKTPAIFGFYGKSNTGKTSLMEKIIKKLTGDGYKVATIKITNKKIGVDTEGKDTWRYAKAGSNLVVLSSLIETDFLIKNKKEIKEILKDIDQLDNYDVVLVEGAHDKYIPKIRIGDIPKRENTIFSYDGNCEEIIKKIKNEIERRKNTMEEISIKVNGKKIPLTEFPSDFIKNTIIGMLNSLKGVNEIKDAEIRIKI